MIRKPVFVLLLSLSIAACAGKTAQPVASYKIGDDDMSCNELKAEMAYIDAQVTKLIPESDKTEKNVALGVAGALLIVPWFYMDLGDAEKVEIKAYQDRYSALEKIYSRKSCARNPRRNSTPVEQKNNTPQRLKALKELHEKGAITDEEYQARHREIINSI